MKKNKKRLIVAASIMALYLGADKEEATSSISERVIDLISYNLTRP